MKTRKFNGALLAFLIMGLTVTGIFAATAEYGSETDPLITVSYINQIVKPQIEKDIDTALSAKQKEFSALIDAKVGSSGAAYGEDVINDIAQRAAKLVGNSGVSGWEVIKIPAGKTLTGKVGCQILPRIGSSVCVSPNATGLINLSDSTVLGSGGALKLNNLYMVTIDGRGVKASADTTVLVKGSYTIS